MTTRVAIVTGAAQGIGRAIALRLAQDGLDVAVNDLPSKADGLDTLVKEINGAGRKVIALTEDVTEEEAVKKMVQQTVESLGRLDVMVANAGIGHPFQSIVDDLLAWERVWEVNIRGVILCYKYAARQMIEQKSGGRIIGASSICGLKGYANMGSYCISKFGVRALTQSSARELHQHNITVNAYAPGVIDTDMARSRFDDEHGGPTSYVRKAMRIPLEARTGEPADIASIVSYLASPEAHFVTGQTMAADGGANF